MSFSDMDNSPSETEIVIKQESVNSLSSTSKWQNLNKEVEKKFKVELFFKEEQECLVENFIIAGKEFSCHHCGSIFSKLRILRLHIKKSHLKLLGTNEDLRTHVMSLLTNPDALYEYVNPSHTKKTKQDKQKNYQCLLCDYRTDFSGNLKRHRLSHHTVNKPHQCKLCDYTASRSDLLKTHVMRHHTSERPHRCLICDFKTVDLRDLKRHVRNIHEKSKEQKSKEKVYQCIFCEYKSEYSSDINRHVFRKHGEKKLQCSFCEYKSSYPVDLQRHIDSRHTKKRPYQCSPCHYKTAIRGHFSRHMRSKKHKALQFRTYF